MRPDIEDSETSDAARAGRHRRGVRLFVALHLGAVGTIYAVALVLGGGFGGPTMPPLTVAMAKSQPTPAMPVPRVAVAATPMVAPAPRPEWTRRPEIAAPWESR